MEIKGDITHMLEPLIETTREAEKDKYPLNDRLLIAQIQLIYFPIYPGEKKKRREKKKRVEFVERLGEREEAGCRKKKERRNTLLLIMN